MEGGFNGNGGPRLVHSSHPSGRIVRQGRSLPSLPPACAALWFTGHGDLCTAWWGTWLLALAYCWPFLSQSANIVQEIDTGSYPVVTVSHLRPLCLPPLRRLTNPASLSWTPAPLFGLAWALLPACLCLLGPWLGPFCLFPVGHPSDNSTPRDLRGLPQDLWQAASAMTAAAAVAQSVPVVPLAQTC